MSAENAYTAFLRRNARWINETMILEDYVPAAFTNAECMIAERDGLKRLVETHPYHFNVYDGSYAQARLAREPVQTGWDDLITEMTAWLDEHAPGGWEWWYDYVWIMINDADAAFHFKMRWM